MNSSFVCPGKNETSYVFRIMFSGSSVCYFAHRN